MIEDVLFTTTHFVDFIFSEAVPASVTFADVGSCGKLWLN
jgi:hypothetical protein